LCDDIGGAYADVAFLNSIWKEEEARDKHNMTDGERYEKSNENIERERKRDRER
jgi:hypothetical protein